MELMTLNDFIGNRVYGQAANPDGLFFQFMAWTVLPSEFRSPEFVTRADDLYFSTRGEKYISQYLYNLRYKGASTVTATGAFGKAAGLIKALYAESWERLFAIYSLEYDPIQNYNSTEKMTNDITTHLHGKTETQSFNDRETENKRTPNTTRTDTRDRWAFNSPTKVHESEDTTTETGTDTTTVKEKGTETLTHGGTDTDTRNYTLTREGNIGVTTSQQMAESEEKLWAGLELFEKYIFKDVDNLLTLRIY